MEVIKLLQSYIDQGFLLHGSQKEVEILDPYKKKNLSKKAGRLKAVYATDSVQVAMFKAILAPSKLKTVNKMKVGVHTWRFLDNDIPQFWITPNYHQNKAFGNGFVYVLDSVEFKQLMKLPHEFYSTKPVEPVFTIKIAPNDLLKKTRLIIWPKEELIKRGSHTEREIQCMGYT